MGIIFFSFKLYENKVELNYNGQHMNKHDAKHIKTNQTKKKCNTRRPLKLYSFLKGLLKKMILDFGEF